MRRSILHVLFLAPLALVPACADSHGLEGDAGHLGDGGGCTGPAPTCVQFCGSDAGYFPVCNGTAWACPPGSVDQSTCPPGCIGPQPGPGCRCEGTTWNCGPTTCPTDFNPWDPTDPRSACSPEGATCSSGGSSVCSSAMSCTCTSGHWNCAIAEPDPVCWCGRQPSVGDACNMEGASCGECCPTPGGTGWPAMQCTGGHWEAAACPAIVCPTTPPGECPVTTSSWLGLSCAEEGASCGDACCDTAIVCEAGVWRPGPVADCFACLSYPCGSGTCRSDESCTSRCGPADGIEYVCTPRDAGCADCSCIPLESWQTCEMIDGHPHVSANVLCG